MIKTLQNTLKQDRVKFKVPRYVQDAVPIQRVWGDGVFQFGTKFSKSIRFSDINYAIASKEDKLQMFLGYSELLNALDTGATTKITIHNKHINRKNFEDTILLPPRDDGLELYRREYNNMLLEKVTGASSSVEQARYITVSTHKRSIEEARTFFGRVSNDITTRLGHLDSHSEELDAAQRLNILHDFYRPGQEAEFAFDLKECMRSGRDFRDAICPDSLEFKKDHFIMGKKYGRVLFLKEYASYIKDTMITELTSLNRNLMLSIDITEDGKFDDQNKGTYVNNTMSLTKYDSTEERYYYVSLPKYASIRVSMNVSGDRTANGFEVHEKSGTSIQYEEGYWDSELGIQVPDHKERLTWQLLGDTEIHPLTNSQNFVVQYHPKNTIPSEARIEGAIIDTRDLAASTESSVSNADGVLELTNAYRGSEFTMQATPPEGYYTVWVNMTGDANFDGYIDAWETPVKTINADYVYGDVISGIVDQDNPVYYYYFAPKTTTDSESHKSGAVVKSKQTIYETLNGQVNRKTEPVAQATVNFAGFSGATDSDGKFNIKTEAFKTEGDACVTVDYDGSRYYTTAAIERFQTITIPAMPQGFTATYLDACYPKNGGAYDITGKYIGIKDNTLEITVSAQGNGVVNPESVRFSIRDYQGNDRGIVMAASGEGGTAEFSYTVSCDGSIADEITGVLTFNPKSVCNNGDQIYVEFATKVRQAVLGGTDGETVIGYQDVLVWQPAVNTGLVMSKDLDMQTFVLGTSANHIDPIETGETTYWRRGGKFPNR